MKPRSAEKSLHATVLIAASFLLASPIAQASGEITRVDSLAMPATYKALPAVTWRASAVEKTATTLTFPAFSDTRLKTLREENAGDTVKKIKIGVNRNTATEADVASPFQLQWQSLGDGNVTRFTVSSTGAKALRVGLRLSAFPDNAELRVAGSANPDNIIGVISGKEANDLRSDERIYWTPMTDGETQTLEVYLPATASPKDIKFSVESVSHAFTSASSGFDTSALKVVGACEINAACKSSSLGDAYQRATRAVAKMAFTTSAGSFVCTGTLLNNTAQDYTPYFWSAAHCISTQSAASTLNTFWFYETAACSGSALNSSYKQLTGGASLLYANEFTDALLLRLNSAPPSNAIFGAWDASQFTSGNMIGVHHPDGDVKKVSTGTGTGASCSGSVVKDSNIDGAQLSQVRWLEGSTEGGSSGSGLLTLDGDTYYLRGGLGFGSASCSNTGGSTASGNKDCYSRLDLAYNSIKQYLAPTSSQPGPTRDYTGQWVNNSESAWGLTVLMNFASNARYLFVPWYIYDPSGKATWYIFEGDNWATNDAFAADVSRLTGPAWGSLPYNNNLVSRVKAGTAKLTFTSATTAKFEYNVDNVSRSMDLVKLQ